MTEPVHMLELLLKTSCSNEYEPTAAYCTVGVGMGLIDLILSRKALFEKLKEQDAGAYEIYLWNGDPDWWDDSSGQFIDEELEKLPDVLCPVEGISAKDIFWDNRAVFLPFGDLALVNGEQSRVECCQMVVGADGVHWTCIPKHGSNYVVTESVGYETWVEAQQYLLKMIEG